MDSNNSNNEEVRVSAVEETKEVSEPKQNVSKSQKLVEALDNQYDVKSGHLYFTEKDLNRILHNLDELRDRVYPTQQSLETEVKISPNFPSVCLIGLGRCGSNIALDVAALVYNARNYYLNEFNDEQNMSAAQLYNKKMQEQHQQEKMNQLKQRN